MTPPPAPDIGILALALLLASSMFDPSVAQIVAPYLVITMGAILGAFINAARQPARATRLGDASVFFCVVVFVWLTAVSAGELLTHYAGLPEPLARGALGLVSIAIGAIGEDWLRIARWALGLAGGAIEAIAKLRSNQGGPQ